jgi:hypothetical protein
MNKNKNIEQCRWRRERENKEIIEFVLYSSSVYLYCIQFWANEMAMTNGHPPTIIHNKIIYFGIKGEKTLRQVP